MHSNSLLTQVAAELAEEDGAIDALASLLHATPGKPSGLSDRSLLNTRPVASAKFGSLKDTPLAAMGFSVLQEPLI